MLFLDKQLILCEFINHVQSLGLYKLFLGGLFHQACQNYTNVEYFEIVP